jgi:tRNA (adenine57-N1/adenine58-N1)-methyltransferase
VSVARVGDLVLLIGPRGKRFIIRLHAGADFQTHAGVVSHDALIGEPFGRVVESHLKKNFVVLEPSIHDLILDVNRNSQIVYPKESGYVLLKMNVFCGQRIIEAGSGSGALTLAFARAVAPLGRVYSYESRIEMQTNARANLERVGLSEYVEFKLRDISEGFDETQADAAFLDVRSPWQYLLQVRDAMKAGGFFGALVPTTNQVSRLISSLENTGFADIEVEELLLRRYKVVPERLRPDDTMVGHTGYMVFARKLIVLPGLPD